MGSPCEPLTPRQDLIAELEGLGYDLFPGVRKDWADWRERMRSIFSLASLPLACISVAACASSREWMSMARSAENDGVAGDANDTAAP